MDIYLTRVILLQVLVALISSQVLITFVAGDVGTAGSYGPLANYGRNKYMPTDCYGSDASQFPSSNLFGAVGDGFWDNGAACGRQYLVRCISAAVTKMCIPDTTIQVRVVDHIVTGQSGGGYTFMLSQTAYAKIANISSTFVNVEFQQV